MYQFNELNERLNNINVDFDDDDMDMALSQCSQDLLVPKSVRNQVKSSETVSGRFGAPVSDAQVNDLVSGLKPKNSKHQENWALRVWSDWASSRNASLATEELSFGPIPETLDPNVPQSVIEYWAKKFIVEVKNAQGGDYNPASVKQLVIGLQRHLREKCGWQGHSFLDHRSPVYKVLDARIKHLNRIGVGLEVKRADIVTEVDEKLLWDKKIFDTETSKGLFHAIFFYTGKVLALRGREEHRNLAIEQFKIKTDSKGTEYLEFWPIVRKNNQGTIEHSKIRKEPIKHFDDPANPRSYVKLLKLYLQALPENCGPFYRRPLAGKSVRYGKHPVGVNTIGTALKDIFKAAGINDTRNVSNHGLRATAASTLFNAGFGRSTIVGRTGHRSNAVDSYLRDSEEMQKNFSRCLDPAPLNFDLKVDGVEVPFPAFEVQEKAQDSVKRDHDKIEVHIEYGEKKVKFFV